MRRALITPSHFIIPDSVPLRRDAPRPPEDRQRGYDDRFDDRTLFYDVFRHGGDIVLSGPPLFNLRRDLPVDGFELDSRPVAPGQVELIDVDRTQRSVIHAAAGDELRIHTACGWAPSGAVGDDHRDLFQGRRTIVSLVPRGAHASLGEWLAFHGRAHGVTAALLYASELGTDAEQVFASAATAGLKVVAVVDWPFADGPPGGPRSRWDSDFSPYSVLEHARLRFLERAAGVLNISAVELVLTDDGRSVFDLAEQAPHHLVRFRGRWVEGATDRPHGPGQQRSFTDYRHHRNLPTPPRWVLVPDQSTTIEQWRVQTVGRIAAPSSLRVLSRKFRNLGNLEAPDRPIDAATDHLDRPLGEAMDQLLSGRGATEGENGRGLTSRHDVTASVGRLASRLRASWKTRRRSDSDAADGRAARLDFLFIMTYGRTGSTLLQGILSSIPGYLIRGENRAMMYSLFNFHQTSVKERQRLQRPEQLPPTHPFYGIDGYPDERAFADIRCLALDTILRPEPDTRVVGFKEIRWFQKDLVDYVGFLRDVFPGARFVVNTRDHAEVAKSKWWGDREDPLAEIRERERRILTAAESLGDAAYHVHYNDYVDDPLALRGLYEWLGESFDVGTIRATMAQPHSY